MTRLILRCFSTTLHKSASKKAAKNLMKASFGILFVGLDTCYLNKEHFVGMYVCPLPLDDGIGCVILLRDSPSLPYSVVVLNKRKGIVNTFHAKVSVLNTMI